MFSRTEKSFLFSNFNFLSGEFICLYICFWGCLSSCSEKRESIRVLHLRVQEREEQIAREQNFHTDGEKTFHACVADTTLHIEQWSKWQN